MEASGLPDGEYALGGQPVYVKDGKIIKVEGSKDQRKTCSIQCICKTAGSRSKTSCDY